MRIDLTRKIMHLPLWLWASIVIFLGGGGLAFYMQIPEHASWRYGACKVFLEQYVRFPTTLVIRQGAETRGSAIISFADINPFGAQQIRIFECHYSTDAQGRTVLSRVTIDRRALPEETVRTFARQLPILAGQKLDTALPKELPKKLEDLKED